MGEIHAIGEKFMKEHLELAISSMKNIESVRYMFVLLVDVITLIRKSVQMGGTVV